MNTTEENVSAIYPAVFHISSPYAIQAVTAVLVAVSNFLVCSSSQNQHTPGEDVLIVLYLSINTTFF